MTGTPKGPSAPSLRKRLERLWAAHPSITDAPRQRRARAASGLLLCLLVLAVADTLLSMTGAYGTASFGMKLNLGAVAGLALAYALSRSGRVTSGVVLAVAVMVAAIFAWRVLSPPAPEEASTLYFLVVPLMATGLLLPVRAAGVTAAFTLLLTFVFEAYLDRLSGAGLDAGELSLGVLLVSVAGLSVAASTLAQRDARLLDRRTAELEAASRSLKEAAAERSRMFNQVAHDLASPLNPIAIQAHLLAKRQGGAEAGKALEIIRRNVDALQRQVEDLKDLARVESQAMRLKMERVDLARLAAQAAESFQAGAHAKAVVLDVAVGGPQWVEGDPARIGQVLYNLLSNAVKFTPPNGRIALTTGAQDGMASLSVRDSGRGLAADEMPLLFRPFSQAHRPEEATERGTGLGLFISKGIVEAHRGDMAVESGGLGQGATFTFRLPLAPPVQGDGA